MKAVPVYKEPSSYRISATIAFIALTFILKGASSESNDAVRRCHWCGPLAEQIHRSRRAQPCDPFALDNQLTDCEPGYNYCAIVATSPPYTESRYCVKLYQDECYSLFCSTTNTWKMSCPCRGDLCNGNNTERETDAFNGLIKITTDLPRKSNAKHSIVKRDTDDGTAATIQAETTEILSPCEQLEAVKNIQTTVLTNVNIEKDNQEDDTESKDCALAKDNPQVEIVPNLEVENSLPEMPKTDDNIKDISPSNTITEGTIETNEPMKPIDDNKVDEPQEITLLPTIEIKPTIALQIENQVSEETKDQIVSEIKQDEIKPSAQMPTAEALQQNVTPATNMDKPTESTIIETTVHITTLSHLDVSTTPSGKNSAYILKLNGNLFVISICLFLL